MSDNELKQYPRGQVSLGSGPLRQVQNIDVTSSNNAQVEATLRANPSGISTGIRKVAGTLEMLVDEDGPERDYWDMVESGKPQQARLTLPGRKNTYAVVFNECKTTVPLEGAVKVSASFVGKRLKT